MAYQVPLRDLVRIYAQREHTYALEAPPGVTSEWAANNRRTLTELAATMTLWANIRAVFTFLAPAVVGILVAVFGASSIWNLIVSVLGNRPDNEENFWLTIGSLLFVLVYLLTGAATATERARGLMLIRGPQPLISPSDAHNTEGENTYQLEDQLYQALEKPKRIAIPVDALLYFAVFVTWAALEAFVGFQLVSATIGRIFFATFAAGFLGAGIWSLWLVRRREFR